jgi:hypothetical protein
MSARKRKSKIKSVIVHKVSVSNYDEILRDLAKTHADIIRRRLNELNATPEQKVLILEGIIAKLEPA